MNDNTDTVNQQQKLYTIGYTPPCPTLEQKTIKEHYSIKFIQIGIVQVYRGFLFILKLVFDPGRIVTRIKS